MADMYERIDALLREKGITGAKMSSDLGMSRSFMTELRKGRAKSVKIETAQKIANYLGVSVEYLTTGCPVNVYQCPDDENPWEIELLDAFNQLDIDRQIEAVEHVQNMVAFSDDNATKKEKEPTNDGNLSVNFAENRKSPDLILTEGEKALIKLLRRVPAAEQAIIIEKILTTLDDL